MEHTASSRTVNLPNADEVSLANEPPLFRGFQCNICWKSFDRKDTLTRHWQVHDIRRPPPKSRKKACIPCAKSKVKCQAEEPVCSSCRRRKLKCFYGPSPKKQAVQPSGASAGVNENVFSFTEPIFSDQVSTLRSGTGLGIPSPLSNRDVNERQRTPDYSSSRTYMDLFSLDPLDESLNVQPNFGWIFDDLPDVGFQMLPDFDEPHYTTELQQQPNSVPQRSASTGIVEAPHPQILANSSSSTDDRPIPEDPWLSDWHTSQAQRLLLPDIGGPDEAVPPANHYAILSITTSGRLKLLDKMRILLDRGPWPKVSLTTFPSCDSLDHCVDLFFVHFNKVCFDPNKLLTLTNVDKFLPIVHRPTFDPLKNPLITLMIVSIGACYTAFSNAKPFSNALSELCRRLLLLEAECDPKGIHTDAYLTSQLLQGTHGYCSGSKLHFENSELCRSSLVNNAKSMGLFHYEPPSQLLSDCDTPNERWNIWIGQERRRRLSWAVYQYDSSVSYLHNIRPYVTIGDMMLDLPSSTAHWEAETPHSWAALHPWGPVPKYVSFRTTIRCFFDGTTDPLSRIGEDSHRLLVMLTLVRMLWTVKEIRRSPICDLIDNSHWVNDARSLLNGIDTFHEFLPALTASAKSTSDQVLQAVRRVQIVHLSHLYGAGDLLDVIYLLVRPSPAKERAEERLLRWAKYDARRVRHVAFHSAQVLAIARHWPGNVPLESFNVFHAGVVLCYMCSFLPPKRAETSPQIEPSAIRIDHLAKNDQDPAHKAIQTWIRDGGNNAVSIFGISDLTEPTASKQVLELTADILGNMTVWGVAQYFRKIVLGLGEAFGEAARPES